MLGVLVFTGIVEHLGRITGLERSGGGGARLTVDPQGWTHTPAHGESVSVSGCCLTVVGGASARPGLLSFDVHGVTLDRTTLGRRVEGDAVNLEHAATPATLLGGHLVQGHVDGVGTVSRMEAAPDGVRMYVSCPSELHRYLVSRGSIAVDGVSLTIAQVTDEGFMCALIPTTLGDTTLGRVVPGDVVNLEADAIARMVERLMASSSSVTDA